MALHSAPLPLSHPRAVPGSRGVPTRVIQDVNDALAPCLEGVAFADAVSSTVARIVMAASAGSRHAVINEAQRLGHRALAERAEFRRLASYVEGPEEAA